MIARGNRDEARFKARAPMFPANTTRSESGCFLGVQGAFTCAHGDHRVQTLRLLTRDSRKYGTGAMHLKRAFAAQGRTFSS